MSKLFLQKIVDLSNGQSAFAEKLSSENEPIKQAHIWNWLNITKDGIPERHVIKACASVDYKITPHQLRPDIYPHPDDGLPSCMRCKCEDQAA